MDRTAIWNRWKAALVGAGIDSKGRQQRATRHTSGTMLYRATKDLRLVQKHLGHARPETTAIYADVLDEDMQEAMWVG